MAARRTGIDRDHSYEAILDAALPILARRGEEGMSLSMLGAAAGLHKATLFYYFRDKAEIARAVFDRVASRLLVRFEVLADTPEPAIEQLIALVEALAGELGECPAMAGLLLRAMVAPLGSTFAVDTRDRAHPINRMMRLLSAWLDRARRQGVIRRIPTHQAILNILALLLFYPAAAHNLEGLTGPTPFSRAARRQWKGELVALLRQGLVA